jgi:hypothetical protein
VCGVAREAEDTRRRLLEAAAREFAGRGIAGARIDRIVPEAVVRDHRDHRDKIDAIARAQKGGRVSRRFPADELVAMITGLSIVGTSDFATALSGGDDTAGGDAAASPKR